MIQQIITAIADIVQVTHLTTTISIAFGMWCLVLCAVLIDLWDGVHTAKVLHRTIRSHKLRITMNKLGEYWRVMLMGFIVDLVGVLFPWYNLPFASVLFCVGIVGIELKSVYEHAKERKSKAAELPTIIKQIVECASEHDATKIVKAVSEYLEESKKSNSN